MHAEDRRTLDDVIAMAAGKKQPELLLINAGLLKVFSDDLEILRHASSAIGDRL